MSESHFAYLSLGSNIEPEANLPKAVQMLSDYGEVQAISSVWESEPVGTTGPNYLNACALFISGFDRDDLKEKVIGPIEARLGRKRSEDKYAPRPIDIDIVLFDGRVIHPAMLDLAFVVVPLAELLPHYYDPQKGETLAQMATRLRREVWLETRPVALH